MVKKPAIPYLVNDPPLQSETNEKQIKNSKRRRINTSSYVMFNTKNVI